MACKKLSAYLIMQVAHKGMNLPFSSSGDVIHIRPICHLILLPAVAKIFHVGKLEGMTIEEAFEEFWQGLVERQPKLAAYPKSYKAELRNAFNQGYSASAKARQAEEDERKRWNG